MKASARLKQWQEWQPQNGAPLIECKGCGQWYLKPCIPEVYEICANYGYAQTHGKEQASKRYREPPAQRKAREKLEAPPARKRERLETSNGKRRRERL